MDIHLHSPPEATVLDQARLLDDLVAASLRDAVAETEAVGLRVLSRAEQLQQLAGRLEPGPVTAPLRALLEEQVADLLRAGQYHDIFSQAVERCVSIQVRRAALVDQLFASMRDAQGAQEPLARNATELLATCRGEQARHGGVRATGGGSIELF